MPPLPQVRAGNVGSSNGSLEESKRVPSLPVASVDTAIERSNPSFSSPHVEGDVCRLFPVSRRDE